MLKHASPYVYVGEEETIAEEIHEDELVSGWSNSAPVAREDVAGVDQGPVEGGVSQVIPASASPAASAPEPRSSILSDLMGVLGRGRGGGASRAEAARAERAGVAAESAFMSSPRPAPKEKAKLKFMRKSKGKRGTGKRQVVDTNVVAVDLGKLGENVAIHSGDVTVCDACRAILSATSKPLFTDEGATWYCEFCGGCNVIDLQREETPAASSVDYILEPSTVVKGSEDTSKVVFCVDVSGSMCVTTEVAGNVQFKGDRLAALRGSLLAHGEGHQHLPGQRRDVTYVSRLQSMQGAVDQQLTDLSQHHPKRQVGLVTFNNEVCVIGDGSCPPVVLSGDKLDDVELLARTGRDCAAVTHSVHESRQRLSDKLFDLEECGQTALGPAMVVAINMASSSPGSQVIVCTDGKANRGLGRLEDSTEDAAALFYSDIAKFAKSKGVTVSVVSIAGEECRLEHLGVVADVTGGEVEKVDPLNLAANFQALLSNPVVACDVKCTMLLHHQLRFRADEAEVQEIGGVSRIVREVGNVTADSEIFLEFSRKPASAAPGLVSEAASIAHGDVVPDNVPLQVHIEYTKPCGMKCLRVITALQRTTTDKEKCERDVNVAICSAHATQKSSRLAQQGDYEQSRLNAFAWRNMMGRHVASESSTQQQQQEYDAFIAGYGAMDDEMLSAQRSEQDDMLSLADAPSEVRKFTRMARRKDSGARNMFKGKKAASKMFAAKTE